MEELLKRINELAHKEKAEGLTEEEIAERTILRNKYRAAFRASLSAQLENTYIKLPDGSEVKLSKGNKESPDGEQK